MHNLLDPIFVGGTGRSGTTAVFRVITTGQGVVAAVPELRVHIDPKGALNLLDTMSVNWSPYQADIAIHEFLNLMRNCRRGNRALAAAARVLSRFAPISPRRYSGLSLGSHFGYSAYDRELEKLLSLLTLGQSNGYWAGTRSLSIRPVMYETKPLERGAAAKIIAGFFDSLYASISTGDDMYWIDSSPYSIVHADKLLELFPRAKFIHVLRSPLDIVASYLKMHWGGSNPRFVANRLLQIHKRWRAVRDRIPKSCFLEVRIEDLANEPDLSWNRIAAFLDRDAAFNFDCSSIKSDALHQDRWQQELSKESTGDAYDILQTVIEEYGYS